MIGFKARKNEGFTLVELILVMLLVGIMAVAAMPAAMNTGGAQAEAAIRKLVADLSYARQLARTRNQNYGVNFNLVSNSYTVFYYDTVTASNVTATDPVTQRPMVVTYSNIPELSRVTLSTASFGGTSIVIFTPQGIPTNGSGTALSSVGSVSLSSGGVQRSLQVEPRTSALQRL